MAAYSLYELLHVLIDRVGWRNEAEQQAAHTSVTEAESMNVLGNLTRLSACTHPNKVIRGWAGQSYCPDCRRTDVP